MVLASRVDGKLIKKLAGSSKTPGSLFSGADSNIILVFSSQEVQPAKHVSVQLDESAVSSAISQFGSVQLPDTITHHPSPVIPVK